MTGVREKGEEVRKYILTNIEKHPSEITGVTSKHFKITRQAVNKHLQRLTAEKALSVSGNARRKTYALVPISITNHTYQTKPKLEEDVIWRTHVLPVLGKLPDNVQSIWHYCFTEIFNNAVDHSDADSIKIEIAKTAITSQIVIHDDGIGIFRKIQHELGLLDERHAVFELAKGKLTTDPKHHTGEGIFFSSRMCDSFTILSGDIWFNHLHGDPEDWVIDRQGMKGTTVFMKLNNHTARTSKKVFDQYTSGEEYGFNKTVIPVELAQYGEEALISRSQAKRVLARVDQFKKVIFDFIGVKEIGQAFADEIFRVFASQHPDIELIVIHANNEVKQMISRAKSEKVS